VKAAPIERIPINHIEANPYNPRRLFDDEPMKILEESIQKLGILVPVTVYPKSTRRDIDFKRDKFVLLDGERRWRCAVELEYDMLPAVIVEQPSETQNILTMFHIHNVRESWQLMPTAIKLKSLMDQLQETNERKLAELTKLSVGQVRRCKILLTLPEKFQNMMLAPPSERMKTDFFIEMQRLRGPALKEDFPPWKTRGDSKCIDILVGKFLKGRIKAVTDFRGIAEIYRGSVRTGQVKRFYRELDHFLRDPNLGTEDIRVPGATFEKEVKEVRRSAKRLLRQISELEVEALIADRKTVALLKKIAKTIDGKLNEALVAEPRNASDED
jgi:ParB family transcriptional regulator, chromosome partitioning protein